MMHVIKSLERSITKYYANFEGRTARKDYIIYIIFFEIIATIITFSTQKFGRDNIVLGIGVFVAALFIIPCVSIIVRRLHDMNFKGWWLLLSTVVPFGIFIIGIILMFYPGTPGPNKYGEPPVD